MSSRSSKILKRTYYEVHFKLASPLCISSGNKDVTDVDIIIDGEGNPFIPGTSIAGVFRNSLDDRKNSPSVMGFSQAVKDESTGEVINNIGRMSQIFISDVALINDSDNDAGSENKLNISIRDGIKLQDDEKITSDKGKFDMQIVEPGAGGCMRFEVLERENDDQNDSVEKINAFIIGLADGEIRFGAKKNRGFGKVKVLSVGEKAFDYTQDGQAEEWLKYLEDNAYEENTFLQAVDYDEWKQGKEELKEDFLETHFAKIKVPLNLSGGISIRKYSTRPGEADYEQLTIKEDEDGNKRVPVVPGSSWNGAIRRDAVRILRDDLKCKEYEDIIDDWFGVVDDKKVKQAQQSKIIISESKIFGAAELPMTRVKINRFDSSAISGGLYSEISFFGGSTNLEILVRKDKSDNYKAAMGLLYLVISDIMNGFVAIGGQTAVGRGIFEGSEFEEFGGLEIEECLASLKSYLEGRSK